VEHFVHPGETMQAHNSSICSGGKGLNHSIALVRAGCKVKSAGTIGKDSIFLKQQLISDRVDCTFFEISVDEL